jgi:hypothetical protein
MPWDRRIDHNRFEYFTRRFYFDGRKQGFPLEHFYETRVAARVRIAEDPSLRLHDTSAKPNQTLLEIRPAVWGKRLRHARYPTRLNQLHRGSIWRRLVLSVCLVSSGGRSVTPGPLNLFVLLLQLSNWMKNSYASASVVFDVIWIIDDYCFGGCRTMAWSCAYRESNLNLVPHTDGALGSYCRNIRSADPRRHSWLRSAGRLGTLGQIPFHDRRDSPYVSCGHRARSKAFQT